eukprot:Skav208589  [mRNA]  locus=scaffold3152:188711:190434:- [translate_table: standard]
MNIRITDTAYGSSVKSFTSSSTAKKVARSPNMAKTQALYARNKSGICAMMAETESTANATSVNSKHITTRTRRVA